MFVSLLVNLVFCFIGYNDTHNIVFCWNKTTQGHLKRQIKLFSEFFYCFFFFKSLCCWNAEIIFTILVTGMIIAAVVSVAVANPGTGKIMQVSIAEPSSSGTSGEK